MQIFINMIHDIIGLVHLKYLNGWLMNEWMNEWIDESTTKGGKDRNEEIKQTKKHIRSAAGKEGNIKQWRKKAIMTFTPFNLFRTSFLCLAIYPVTFLIWLDKLTNIIWTAKKYEKEWKKHYLSGMYSTDVTCERVRKYKRCWFFVWYRKIQHMSNVWGIHLAHTLYNRQVLYFFHFKYHLDSLYEKAPLLVLYGMYGTDVMYDLIVWENTNVVHFSCFIGQYNTRPMNKVFA